MNQQLSEVLLGLLYAFGFRMSLKHPWFREEDFSLKQNSAAPKSLPFPLLPPGIDSGRRRGKCLLLGPLCSSSVPGRGLLCLNPIALRSWRWAGTWCPSREGSVQSCGGEVHGFGAGREAGAGGQPPSEEN